MLYGDLEKMIYFLDKNIEMKKTSDPETYKYEQAVKSVMQSLNPKKGHKLKNPCRAKMLAYKFLSKAYDTDDHYNMDFEAEHLTGDCNHTFREDNDKEFERNICVWYEKFKKEVDRQKKLRPREIDRMVY